MTRLKVRQCNPSSRALLGAVLLMTAGCLSDTHSTLEILRVLAPDGQECILNPSATTELYAGTFDPTLGSDYTLGFEVLNRAESETASPQAGSSGENIRSRGNDVTLSHAEVCWVRAADPENVTNIIDCEALPEAQRAVIPLARTIERDSGRAGVGLSVLTLAHLRGLYGAAFSPTNIPLLGFSANGNVLSTSAENNTPQRNAAWGQFPQNNTPSDTVIVQTRMHGRLLSGTSVKSNWFKFPVDICIRCLGAPQCGLLSKVYCPAEVCAAVTGPPPVLEHACPTPCVGGEACDNGECADGSACSLQLETSTCNGSAQSCTPAREIFQTVEITGCRPSNGFGACEVDANPCD